MLTLPDSILHTMLEHARQQHPLECCGVVAAPLAGPQAGRATRVIPMHNHAASETWFSFDSRQQLQVWREMEANDEVPLVLYHSHTSSRAWPSADDIAFAQDPALHYLIISTDPRHNEVRSFRIVHGEVMEETVRSEASGASVASDASAASMHAGALPA